MSLDIKLEKDNMYELTQTYIESIIEEGYRYFVLTGSTLHCFQTERFADEFIMNNPYLIPLQGGAIESKRFLQICDSFQGQYSVTRHGG